MNIVTQTIFMDFKGIGGFVSLVIVVIIGVAIASSRAFTETKDKVANALKGK